jgi:ankyrin repeat protein
MGSSVGFPAFEITFRSGGNVEFHGLGGCALPGTHHYTIPDTEWKALVERVRSSDFFSMSRLGPTAYDVLYHTITYRDARRIHEVIDAARNDKQLNELEKAMRTAGHVEPWIEPTPELYRKASAKGWDINSRNEDGWTALQCAVENKRDDLIRLLLKAGARVSPETFRAAFSFRVGGDTAILELLDEAAPLDVRSPMASELLRGAVHANPDTLRYLLDRGVSIDSRDSQGATVLMTINHRDPDLQTFDYLLSRKPDVNAIDRAGKSAMHYAAGAANSGFITKLAHAGARVDLEDRQGFTPLMYAADGCRYWNVRALMDAGADPKPALTAFPTAERQWSSRIDPKCRETQKVLATR